MLTGAVADTIEQAGRWGFGALGFQFASAEAANACVNAYYHAYLYDAQRTPEVYVIDSTGKLRYHGRITENHEDASSSPDLKNALDALLAGRTVEKTVTKAFGCTIKRA